MTVYRVIFTCTLMAAVAVGYVHQRIELIKLGYGLQESREYLSGLVDQNSKLMYNLSRLESPRSLLASLDAEKIEFAGQRTESRNGYLLVCSDPGNEGRQEGLIDSLLDVFTVRAEAKTRGR
ncbi:MAG: hypothetical protein KAS86_01080 [Candidatus Omnitrophica bacterium]|nr:hypothetical protein [Candidatus Omnitrophota bacterium]